MDTPDSPSAFASASASPPQDDAISTPSENNNPSEQEGQNKPSPEPKSAATQVQTLTHHALEFLSNASNETLGAVFVGLVAATYVILGRLGLLLIGIAGGVILHASWENFEKESGNGEAKAKEAKRRRELGTEVAKRVLEWREGREINQDASDRDEESADVTATEVLDGGVEYAGFQPATGAALTTLTDAIIRDYVRWWYGPILPSENAFPLSCRSVLTGFIISTSTHLSRKRPADTFLHFLTNSSSIIIVFLNELSTALSAVASYESPSDAVQKYLEQDPDSNLANVLSVKQQQKKLSLVADDILHTFLDSKAYSCDPVKIFLREIFSGVVLESTIKTCSQPEWINGWIIYLLEEGEPELMNAIDAGVEGARKDQLKSGNNMVTPGEEDAAKDSMEAKRSEKDSTELSEKRRTKAQEAMEEAMLEAKRLNEMIAAEEEARKSIDRPIANSENGDTLSSAPTEGIVTPSSSDSGRNGDIVDNDASTAEVPEHQQDTHQSGHKRENTFTSFDQIAPVHAPTALQAQPTVSTSMDVPPLTLHNATISILDDTVPGDRATIRTKPTTEYLLQIEPASSRHPGWMIPRKYADFEKLHEVLRRISVVSGVPEFTEQHSSLPSWKGQTKSAHRQSLEQYLQSALKFERLAESEGMKRFLEKSQSPISQSGKSGFAFPSQAFENMGKGVLGVLTSAPKGVAGGGKAVFEGVTGAFNAVGGNGKNSPGATTPNKTHSKNFSTASLSRENSNPQLKERKSQDSYTTSLDIPRETGKPPLPRRPSALQMTTQADQETPVSSPSSVHSPGVAAWSNRSSTSIDQPNRPWAQPYSARESEELNLPPPPSEITDDYKVGTVSPKISMDQIDEVQEPERTSTSDEEAKETPAPAAPKPDSARKQDVPISEEETRMAVELLFAVINELYTLSSAWNIRKTLLNAAKSFLLRPGNPNLEAIRVLLQDSIIDSNVTDDAMAAHILKLRENSLPTEEELKLWPPPPSDEEKERLRVKARKLLVQRGMPQALTSVMGAAASGEALGRVFDCLQVEQVSRGFIFALILQALKAATQ
ncbi:hypothetical protein FQN54_000951 [Arachnomyces sp. PD_36]|nr:hypothetical protein FQN54_000951 [Arachnomyces sp. PD_36]